MLSLTFHSKRCMSLNTTPKNDKPEFSKSLDRSFLAFFSPPSFSRFRLLPPSTIFASFSQSQLVKGPLLSCRKAWRNAFPLTKFWHLVPSCQRQVWKKTLFNVAISTSPQANACNTFCRSMFSGLSRKERVGAKWQWCAVSLEEFRRLPRKRQNTNPHCLPQSCPLISVCAVTRKEKSHAHMDAQHKGSTHAVVAPNLSSAILPGPPIRPKGNDFLLDWAPTHGHQSMPKNRQQRFGKEGLAPTCQEPSGREWSMERRGGFGYAGKRMRFPRAW